MFKSLWVLLFEIFILRDDEIKYKSKNKKDGYDLIDGSKDTAIGIKPTPRGKKTTHLPNYSTVTDFAKFLGWSTSVPLSLATW